MGLAFLNWGSFCQLGKHSLLMMSPEAAGGSVEEVLTVHVDPLHLLTNP